MVAGQSSSGSLTQPTRQRFILRSVAAIRFKSATQSGKTCRPKRAVGVTQASKKRILNLSEMWRLTSHRLCTLNFAQASASRLPTSALTRVEGSRLRRRPRYRCDRCGWRISTVKPRIETACSSDGAVVRILVLSSWICRPTAPNSSCKSSSIAINSGKLLA